MKTLQVILLLFLFASCSDRQSKTPGASQKVPVDTVIKHDTMLYSRDNDWQEGFGLTHDPEVDSIWHKPVTFYSNNPKCSPVAEDFYSGAFRPADNSTTAALLALSATDDDSLRPFYRWCLSKTIQMQDGALAEYTGVPARQYAEKFPKEFFEYIDTDTTEGEYKDWVSAISYSGFYGREDYKKPQNIRKNMIRAMKRNCGDCSQQLRRRIDRFAADCFP